MRGLLPQDSEQGVRMHALGQGDFGRMADGRPVGDGIGVLQRR
jgi:hypothetical protein